MNHASESEVVPSSPPHRGSAAAGRRRGRPAGSDGLTAQRIVAAARDCFAESGYAAASTHMVAARVGLTTGALYQHFGSKRELFYQHFGSKRELYLAVFDEVERVVFERFRTATASQERFSAKMAAVLDETARSSETDPAVAGFLVSANSDLARHPDLLAAADTGRARWSSLLGEIVDPGVATGVVGPADGEKDCSFGVDHRAPSAATGEGLIRYRRLPLPSPTAPSSV